MGQEGRPQEGHLGADSEAFTGHLVYALKQDTHTALLCILASDVAPSHRKPSIPEDLRLHVLNPNLVTGLSSAIARNVSPPGASAIRKMRVGVIVWTGGGVDYLGWGV